MVFIPIHQFQNLNDKIFHNFCQKQIMDQFGSARTNFLPTIYFHSAICFHSTTHISHDLSPLVYSQLNAFQMDFWLKMIQCFWFCWCCHILFYWRYDFFKGFWDQRRLLFFLPFFNVCILDIFFSSNHKVHKSLCGLCFWALDPLIERFL